MSFRDFQKEKPAVVAGIAAAILIVAVLIVFAEFRRYFPSAGGAAGIGNVYFYDLGTNQLIVENGTTIPPIPSPSGGDKLAVRAYVYSCGDCSNAGTRKVAYLEMFTPEAKAEIDKAGFKTLPFDWATNLPPAALKGWMVRAGEGSDWVSRQSPEGNKLAGLLQTGCGDPLKTPTNLCLPPP